MSEEQWSAARPRLTRANQQVLEVWDFCDGWNPAVLPLAAAFYRIEDLDMLVTQLLVLRQVTEAHAAKTRART